MDDEMSHSPDKVEGDKKHGIEPHTANSNSDGDDDDEDDDDDGDDVSYCSSTIFDFIHGPIISRIVPIGIPASPPPNNSSRNDAKEQEMMFISVYEAARPSELLETWAMDEGGEVKDPCGTVMWPGSILASREMYKRRSDIFGKNILILGAGTGLEAQVAARLGAAKVIATDVNQQTLDLLDYGAKQAGLSDIITSKVFDLFGDEMLPLEEIDVVLAADVMYNQELSIGLGKRVIEMIDRKGGSPGIIVVDSQRFDQCDFLPALEKELKRSGNPIAGTLEWKYRTLQEVTTSAFCEDEDQTFTKEARFLSF